MFTIHYWGVPGQCGNEDRNIGVPDDDGNEELKMMSGDDDDGDGNGDGDGGWGGWDDKSRTSCRLCLHPLGLIAPQWKVKDFHIMMIICNNYWKYKK